MACRSEGFVRSTRRKLAWKNDSSSLMSCSPASIEVMPAPSLQHGPSVPTRRHPGGNQDRRGRTPAEPFFRLTLSREFHASSGRTPRLGDRWRPFVGSALNGHLRGRADVSRGAYPSHLL